MKKLFIILFFFFNTNFVFGQTFEQIDDLTLYFFTSDKQITVGWDNADNTTDYDLYLWHVEQQQTLMIANIPHDENATQQTFPFYVPRSGHYHLYVRSVQQPLHIDYMTEIDAKADMQSLEDYVKNLDPASSEPIYVCDVDTWWDDTATLAEMKIMAKSQKGICSIYIVSIDHNYALVTIDGNQVNRGWWLYGHVAPPTGGGVD